MAWLAFVVAVLATLVALGATISAWWIRRTTPRRASLVLGVGACFALLVAATDRTVELPSWLCTEEVAPGDATLAERLRHALGRWTWIVRPCARLVVPVAADDLRVPIALGDLVERAAEAEITVDVRLADEVSPPTADLVLALDGVEEHVLPVTTPIPRSYTNLVRPTLAGETSRSSLCVIGEGPPKANATLDALLGGGGPGFHRLRCWPAGDLRAAVTVYVRVVAEGVVFASSETAFVEKFKENRLQQSAELGFDLGDIEELGAFGLAVPRVVSEGAVLRDKPTASMLVLDRPQDSTSCAYARELLSRGATVVVARPGPALAAAPACDFLPVRPRLGAEALTFETAERLTFVFSEDFEVGLEKSPTLVLGCTGARPANPPLLAPSIVAQGSYARGLCQAFGAKDCPAKHLPERLSEHIAAEPRAGVSMFKRPPAPGQARCGGCEKLDGDAPMVALASLAHQLARRGEAWEHELVVVFTHDPRGLEALEPLRSFASGVQVVPITDPYGRSLGTTCPPALANLPELPEVVVDASARELFRGLDTEDPTAPCFERSVSTRPKLPIREFFKRKTGARRVLAPNSITRFPQLSEDAKDNDEVVPPRFGWWEPKAKQGLAGTNVVLAKTTTTAGIVERPLAVGTMVERGHLVFLSHSPFEAVVPTSLAADLLTELYAATDDFTAEVHGAVVGVEVQADGALWITVAQEAQELLPLSVRIKEFPRPIDAPLVDFEIERGRFTYAVPAAELAKLPTCTPLTVAIGENSPAIHACPPIDLQHGAGPMEAVEALSHLAYFTGGHVAHVLDDEPRPLQTRGLGVGLLSLILLATWGRRALRRLRSATLARQIHLSERIAQRRYDPPDTVVAAAGDWDGRTTTWSRTGVFGGYRTLEPGDRASAVILGDLLVRQLGRRPMIPRVTLRIEEAAPVVLVVINLGASMRVPGSAERSKARFAARVGYHLGASAWKIGGEVAIHAAGIAGESEVLGPTRLGPGYEAFERDLQRELRRPGTATPAPWPRDLPDCGALVYVSDFQHEDVHALQVWLADLEGGGIRAGGVMIHCPSELAMVEGGRLAGTSIWADRADWSADDVLAAFCRRRDEIERIFDATTTGGLTVVATMFNQDDLELAIAEGRLLHILR